MARPRRREEVACRPRQPHFRPTRSSPARAFGFSGSVFRTVLYSVAADCGIARPLVQNPKLQMHHRQARHVGGNRAVHLDRLVDLPVGFERRGVVEPPLKGGDVERRERPGRRDLALWLQNERHRLIRPERFRGRLCTAPASKPGAWTVKIQTPPRRPRNENCPLASVVAVADEGEAFGFSAVIGRALDRVTVGGP